MYAASQRPAPGAVESAPAELSALMAQVQSLPPDIRDELAPAVADAIDQARFRGRALLVAREALERLHLELELTRFDLEITRRERDEKRLGA